MKVSDTIQKPILEAVVVMLKPFVPNISASSLIEALKQYSAQKVKSGTPVKHYTITETARITGLSRPTLYRMINSGELKYNKKTGRKRIPEPELIRLGFIE